MQMNRRRAALAALGIAMPLFSATVPRPSPEFTANLPGGGRFSLSQYKGKVVVLVFISPT
jgi:hypothetical protein